MKTILPLLSLLIEWGTRASAENLVLEVKMAEMTPRLTIKGISKGTARIEFSENLSGPWTTWSNVLVTLEGATLLDLTPGSSWRFYRAVTDPKPIQPEGFIWIAPGTFRMGSPLSEPGRNFDETQHQVMLNEGFWLSDHEVTQAEYQAVMGFNPSHFKGLLDHPVERVSWNDAVRYCQTLTERERAGGRITGQQAYRLPTEAEWEFAARAGAQGPLAADLVEIAWYSDNSGMMTRPVKSKAANGWGLYDMIGNVWEWCWDWYGDYPTASVRDPLGPYYGDARVIRGAGWVDDGWFGFANGGLATGGARLANRGKKAPDYQSLDLGFRTVLGPILPGQTIAPSITLPPDSGIWETGQTASFSAKGFGTPPLRYQWELNGLDLVGEVRETLIITNVQQANAGDYRVKVSNPLGTVISAAAKLTVIPAPVVPGGFVWIRPGTFVMGSNDPERRWDEFEHVVSLTKGFWLSDHEVTQGEYQLVMGINPSHFKGDDYLPVESVSWNEAVVYCQRLTERERLAGRITSHQAYRLPTEAEWEYAARAGTVGPRHGTLEEIGWYSANSSGSTHLVRKKLPNAWGLYDMLGNLMEWCSDWYGSDAQGNQKDPQGPSSGSTRVLRGGSWNHAAQVARSAARWTESVVRQNTIGFRPALSSFAPVGTIGPVMLSPPQPVVSEVGKAVSFSVTALGSAPLAYQWQLNGVDLAGADEATLTITDVRLVHAGDYRVTVSDRTGSVTSAVAKLTVSPSPIGPAGFVWIPPGDFARGSPKDEIFRLPNEAQHTVKLTKGFWMSDHEVTHAEFEEVMKIGSSSPKDERNFPVAWVNWEEAFQYCATLTARERAAGRLAVDHTYRLPTEAEWEYSARAGTAGPRYGNLDEIAWHSGNSSGGTHLVMKKLPNAWGLHDMIGNVWEWCADWYENYPTESVTDPRGPASGSLRVLRGGNFGVDQRNARVAFRTGVAPLVQEAGFGFRVVLSSER